MNQDSTVLERPQYWKHYLQLAGQADKVPADYLAQLHDHGYLAIPPRAALELDDATVAALYAALADARLDQASITSPQASKTDSSWMVQSDFCFVNVRACGLDRDRPGSFIDALRLLLALPATAIHLAPFFECVFGNVYAINSLTHINPDCVRQDWQAEGLDALSQLRLFVDAAHLLGKSVGFDLEPHTAQFSRVVLDTPEYFRWLALAATRDKLRDGLSQDEMLEPAVQEAIVAEVREIASRHCLAAGIKFLEDPANDTRTSREVQDGIVRELIGRGLWTIPSHTWGGVGLPGFIGYNHEGEYPLFEYLDAEGNDQSAHAFGMLTPFALSRGLCVNTAPDEAKPSIPWQPGLDALAGVFPRILKLASFDFIRLDYVDHVFDSVLPGTDALPVSDRLTPAGIRHIITTARKLAPQTGIMAERMGYDLDRYAHVGCDLILGADILRAIDLEFLLDLIRFQGEIATLNQQGRTPVSIQYAIDTHDTGHPQIQAIPAKAGREAVLLRMLLARLSSAGKGRRPMYEVMGNQDMTFGLYEANNRPISLEWRNDGEFFHSQEAVRRFLKAVEPILAVSCIRETQLGPAWLMWCIDRLDGVRQRLVCLCRPETGTRDEEAANIRLYPFNQYWFDEARIDELDVMSGTGSFVPIEVDGTIMVKSLAKGQLRIYQIRENGQAGPGGLV